VVILASSVLEELVKNRKVIRGARVDLARSVIAMAVRAGGRSCLQFGAASNGEAVSPILTFT
jgi:hypothetical protein